MIIGQFPVKDLLMKFEQLNANLETENSQCSKKVMPLHTSLM